MQKRVWYRTSKEPHQRLSAYECSCAMKLFCLWLPQKMRLCNSFYLFPHAFSVFRLPVHATLLQMQGKLLISTKRVVFLHKLLRKVIFLFHCSTVPLSTMAQPYIDTCQYSFCKMLRQFFKFRLCHHVLVTNFFSFSLSQDC